MQSLDLQGESVYHKVASFADTKEIGDSGVAEQPISLHGMASLVQQRWRQVVICVVLLVAGLDSSLVYGAADSPPEKRGALWNFWPFYYSERVLEEGSREQPPEDGHKINRYILYPLVHHEVHRDRSILMVKPLFNVEYAHSDKFRQYQVLWPFFLYRRDKRPGRKEFWFMPIVSWRSEPSAKRKKDKDFLFAALFPLFTADDDDDPERKGFVFGPLIGSGCQIMAYERMDYVLWPLYIRRQRFGDVRYDYPWPLFGHTTGERTGFRIWPIYVKKEHYGHYKKHWALWPFVYWGTANMDKRYPVRMFGLFPLYRSYVSSVAYERRVLCILYRQQGNRITGEVAREYLWPFSRFNTKPKKRKNSVRFWPLFTHTKRPTLTRTAALYVPRRMGIATMPLIWHEDNREVPNHRRKSFSFFPLWFDTKSYYLKGPMSGYQRLFPLYGYERTIDGGRRLGVFSLPHFHDTLAQGFERNYSVLGLYQYRSWPNGFKTTQVMGTLYRNYRGQGFRDFQLAFLYGQHRDDRRNYYHHQYLFGLYRHGYKEGRKILRIVYIPFKR